MPNIWVSDYILNTLSADMFITDYSMTSLHFVIKLCMLPNIFLEIALSVHQISCKGTKKLFIKKSINYHTQNLH